MSVQYDSTPRAVVDGSNVVRTLGVASLGGTIGVRVIIDDTVLTSEQDALLALKSVETLIKATTWPAS